MKSIIFLLLLYLNLYSTLFAPETYTLITSLYHELHEARQNEYLACLERNLKHPMIEHIHIFYDVSLDSIKPEQNVLLKTILVLPVSISFIYGRPSFSQCFSLANNQYVGKKIIIANADIYFNETLNKLDYIPLEETFITLTRWNVSKSGKPILFQNKRSQDTWIFQSPIRPFKNDSYKLGTLGCDSYIAYQAQEAGMNVINPARTIQTCHIHKSGVRHYPSGFLPDPAIGVPITSLEEHTN